MTSVCWHNPWISRAGVCKTFSSGFATLFDDHQSACGERSDLNSGWSEPRDARKKSLQSERVWPLGFWSENYMKTSYGSLIYYYVNDNKLHKQLNLFRRIWRCGDVNQREYQEFFDELGISEMDCKNVVFVTDRASNMKAAFDPRKIKNWIQRERVNCAAHSIERKVWFPNSGYCRDLKRLFSCYFGRFLWWFY